MSSVWKCPACGHDNAVRAGAVFCVVCGQPLAEGEPSATEEPAPAPGSASTPELSVAVDIPDHLLRAVMITVVGFFCASVLPAIPGAIAIAHAIQVSNRVTAGDIDGARWSSAQAQRWAGIAGKAAVPGGVVFFVWLFIGWIRVSF